jgi:proteasome lid subunit RPN8/RPN11
VVEISAALPAHSDDHGPIHFTFTADAWARIHKDRAARHPNLSIVGWFHTHPGLGVFYSSDDVVVHSAAFTLAWHVGLVVDPISKEASFFGWKAGAVTPIGGFYASDEALVPWKAVQTAVWDHEYSADDYDQRVNSVEPPEMPDFRAAFDSIPPKTGFTVGLMGIALALLLFFFAVVPLNRRATLLETAVLSLADETLATTNAATCPDPRLRLLTPTSGEVMAQGSTISIIGTADFPDTYKYLVEVRQLEPPSAWAQIDSQRRGATLGELATWETDGYGRGVYELRLTAVDRNNLPLNQTPCSIAVGLQ